MADEDEQKQCRICLDGTDAEPELGKLIRPCKCRSYVHVRCLQRWRTSSTNQWFWECPQCHYHYRFARTRVVGIASNPLIVAGISGLAFTLLTLLSSYITTYLLSYFQGPTSSSFYYSSSSYWFYDPTEVIHDLVRAALRIIQDEDSLDVGSVLATGSSFAEPLENATQGDPGVLKRFIRRFVIGLPLIGASSLIHMMLSIPFIGPVQWIARFRGRRQRNDRDISAIIIAVLIIVGAARALYGMYQLTQSVTKRLLLRAEDAILEVN
ncbi:hypothetical protein BDP27DRAFT_1385202 [Rhodocollybia butyracea]|uniref:RING-CH-type domain-containing protein n=1 Tax=Rhodocollybia butyracea TaxID=206335 RepID=A0A9P5PBS2_9AGAR|nr:hypothetical protein BDP27DRAFT_1385202 [Rhodocollybia butyracea]